MSLHCGLFESSKEVLTWEGPPGDLPFAFETHPFLSNLRCEWLENVGWKELGPKVVASGPDVFHPRLRVRGESEGRRPRRASGW